MVEPHSVSVKQRVKLNTCKVELRVGNEVGQAVSAGKVWET
ncbi:hypothetical protein E2C01_096740 [Portunus trituberculatus]|uniref:Uncharacterized protein n=1 Tax=Portunus trituberculatus TaxID=210409 RepID=A0A5B7JTA8_PORTR|nr:hypothetical protein [Portunus trituberculatus]